MLVTLPLPHKHLHPNARPHWAAKAKATKLARKRGHDAALIVWADVVASVGMFRNGIQVTSGPGWKLASIRAVFYVKDKRGISADQDGRIASLKAYCDGIADAGIVENDRGFRWASPPVEHRIDKTNPRVEVVICELEPGRQ